ncbi:MAG: class I SAM-dependent methyltransferase [Salinarchaeum sp.]
MSEQPLAAIVPKQRGEALLEALRDEGVYDPDRQIREHGDGTLAIPVTVPPETDVIDVARQVSPTYRERDLETLLRDRGWSEADLASAPSSWAVVGSVILVAIPSACPDETAVGEALLDLHGHAETVLAREGIDGPRRTPDRRVIAGSGDTETIHTEHGVQYALDLAEVMFSPGNKAERARMAAAVAADTSSPAMAPETVPDQISSVTAGTTERVFDMFAGIGYFTLPMAVAGAEVLAAEINPTAFRYLIENAQLNDVGNRVGAYLADCRDVVVDPPVDRVVMGHYDAPEYLDTALKALAPDGVLHLHAAVPTAVTPDRPASALETAVTAADRSIASMTAREIKTYAEGVSHVVIDARIR